MLVKDFIGKHFIGKKMHVTCDCLFPIDVEGTCVDYSIEKNEVIVHLQLKDNRIFKFGENHPNMEIEIL